MTDTASAVLANVAESPVQQALLAAFFTLFMEDPTVIVCGLLIADGQMSFVAALIGLALGIHVGDLTLYLVGRFFGDKILEKGWMTQERYDRWAAHLDRNLFMAVVISRFVPGTRIPAFMGAGILKAPFHRFLLIGITASFMWTLFLLLLVIQIGEQVLPLLGQYKYPAIAMLLLGLLIIPRARRAWLKRTNKLDSRPAPEERVASVFAFWHPVIFYTPVAFYYLFLALKYRSLSLPSAANPSIYSGGVVRDSKSEVMALVPGNLLELFPKTRFFRKKASESPRDEMVRVAKTMEEAGMAFPLVTKPDIGHRGDGVCLVRNRRALAHYLHRFPPGEPVVLQELAEWPNEAGVLYYRFPGEQRGHLLSLTLKDFPVVVGDGRKTLEELILADSRARLISEVYFVRHKERLKRVLPKGRKFRLAFCGVHCKGAIFRNATPSITPELTKKIHEMASQLPHFYFGRFDVRFRDLSTFLRGEEFQIIEINGASSESTHIWDRNISLGEAYSVLFRQFDILFRIGDLNRRAGHQPTGAVRLLKDFIHYRRQSSSYPTAS